MISIAECKRVNFWSIGLQICEIDGRKMLILINATSRRRKRGHAQSSAGCPRFCIIPFYAYAVFVKVSVSKTILPQIRHTDGGGEHVGEEMQGMVSLRAREQFNRVRLSRSVQGRPYPGSQPVAIGDEKQGSLK